MTSKAGTARYIECMVPKVVQDAGYTAVGLGVLAVHQVQTRRRDLERKVRAGAAPVTGLLDALPRLPGPIGSVLDAGRARLAEALRSAA
jgi:hypothetical protein